MKDGHELRIVVAEADPLGREPLFYNSHGATLLLSDNPWDAGLGAKQEVRAVSIADFLEFDAHVRFNGCHHVVPFVSGVSQVPPGHCSTFRYTGRDWSTQTADTWTGFRAPAFGRVSLREAVSILDAALVRVLERLLVSHERVACLVTGGLDSSLVAALVAKLHGRPPVLLSAGAALDCPPERRLKQALAAHLETPILEPSAQSCRLDLAELVAVNRKAPVPSGGLFTTVYRHLVELAQEHGCDLVLSGEGGNEVHDTTPRVLHDLLKRRRYVHALGALGRFAAATGNNALKIASDLQRGWPGGAPLSRVSHEVVSSWYGEVRHFLPELCDSHSRTTASFLRSGWDLAVYESYRRSLAVAYHQPVGGSADTCIESPLVHPDVFLASHACDPLERLPMRAGVENRHLLRLVARRHLPLSITEHRKIGTPLLLRRLHLEERNKDIYDLFSASGLANCGVSVGPSMAAVDAVPPTAGFPWALLLTAAAWMVDR